jgi:hypothetical protein
LCTRAVSALGHYLEEAGIATVAIALIRPQAENTKPPRALWVPFELGRPFGPPNDPLFQKRVIMSALDLLERQDGPVIIEDFRDDDPRGRPDPAWHPPEVALTTVADSTETRTGLENEIPQLRGAHDRWISQHGRTTVGLSALSMAECGRYVADWVGGKAPPSPRGGFSSVLLLRFAVDDLKAYYLEAASAGPAKPSSQQLGDWFWSNTAAGAAISALRAMGLASEDARLKAVLGNFMVPAARVAMIS